MLVDSNILVYAINIASPKHRKAKEFLKKNIGNLEVAQQNIFESLRVLTHPKFPRPMKTQDAVRAVDGITEACRLIHPDYETHYLALELVKRNQLFADQVFDAYLVATALTNDVKTIATDNVKHFQKFPIRVIDPFS